jgi:hypothetical protein
MVAKNGRASAELCSPLYVPNGAYFCTLLMLVYQHRHILGRRTVSLADSVHVAARNRQAAVPHPLPHRAGLGTAPSWVAMKCRSPYSE